MGGLQRTNEYIKLNNEARKLQDKLEDKEKRIAELEGLLAEAHSYIMLGLKPNGEILQRIADAINKPEGGADD